MPHPYVDESGAPAVSTRDTMMLRYAASVLDNVLAIVGMYVLAKSIPDRYPALQAMTFVSTYFLYFFILEALTGRTIGKFMVGLVIIQLDGRRITWWQALVRTLLRLVEVNPVLFGALPAWLAVMRSPWQQRIGDRLAGTIVVRSWRWRQYLKQSTT